MDTAAPPRAGFDTRQIVLIGAVFALVVTALGIGYWLFLRTDYAVLYSGLRASDASEIVAELETRKIDYRLRDGGTTILVPETQADGARVAIAGSEAGARGQVGFELFNKSDMGLTNFAQKINYQRALQGELVRTIMLMDGIDSARVHLAIPERALFRGERNEPKAAVTVTMKPGRAIDAARVTGIQRLVAAAVPDLPEAKVVVLDEAGRVVSPEIALDDRPAEIDERAAVEQYYRARVRAAVAQTLPGLRFVVRLLALPAGGPALAGATAPGEDPAQTDLSAGADGARNFRLRVTFVTEASLNAEDQQLVRDAIARAVAVDAARGDTIDFEIGPVDPAAAPATATARSGASADVPVGTSATPAAASWWPASWFWWLAALVLIAAIGWRLRPRDAAVLSGEDHDTFAERLRRQLNLSGEPSDVAG